MARKSKYTPEVVARVAEAIRNGATYELAAAYAGIDYSTFARWQNTKSEFCEAIKSAEGAGAMSWLTMIEQATPTDWHAAAWKLERRYPHMYGKTVQQQEHSISGNVTVTHEHRLPDNPEAAAAARALLRLVGTGSGASDASGPGASGE